MVAGPNGAGKSTLAPSLLRDAVKVHDYVNADPIARGLSAFSPETQAIAAGRVMLARLRELAAARRTFALETTLASRSYARWLRELIAAGYRLGLIFLWLGSPELAADRVRQRVLSGGHDVPADVIRRRYWRGIRNFRELYRPLAHRWWVYDNSGMGAAVLLAAGAPGQDAQVFAPKAWTRFEEAQP